jgi:hypothetical protein
VDIGIHCTLLGIAVGYSHSHSHSQSPRVFVRVENLFCILVAFYLNPLVLREGTFVGPLTEAKHFIAFD